MRDLLYLTHRIPFPPNKGDKIRSYHVLRYLQRHFRVHLGSFIDDDADLGYPARLQRDCASSCFIRLPKSLARLASLAAYARGEALSVAYYRHRSMQRWVEQTLTCQRISVAMAFSGPMAQYLPARTASGPLQRVLDLVDVDSEKWHNYAAHRRWPLTTLYRREARHLLDYERDMARRFDQVILVSPTEAELFRTRAPESAHKTHYFSNGVDSRYFAPLPSCPDPYRGAQALVFTGAMDYLPNIEAVTWLAQNVLPALQRQFPALQFHIVGARPTPAIKALRRQPGIHVSGTVADIRPYLQHAALAVAPLQIARGIQNKVLEAMAMAKTVVATPQAIEGLNIQPGQDLLCARDATDFIAVISGQLLRVGDFGANARRRVLRDYQWDRNLEHLGALLHVTGSASLAAESGS